MTTAEQLRHEFERFMESHGVKYMVLDEADNTLALLFDGATAETHVLVDFDEAGGLADGVNFRSESFATCNGSVSGFFPKLNQVNRDYRWVKFWISDDGSISATCDAVVYPGSVGEECTQVAFRMAQIIDEALKVFGNSVTVSEDTLNALKMLSLLTQYL